MPAPFFPQYSLKLPVELERALLGLRHLPSLPSVAIRLIELAQEPEIELTDLADTLALDMALSARLLRIANLPLYASHRRIDRLSQALTLLGKHASVHLALGFCLPETADSTQVDQPDNDVYALQQQVWRRSLLAAQSARLLGRACGEYRSEELGLAALLQDIGILAWLHVQPERYRPLFQVAIDNATLLHTEREYWGFNHADLGAYLVAQWNFPPYLVQAIARSENVRQSSNSFECCVALSGLVADLLFADESTSKIARRQLLAQLQEGLGARLKLDEAVSEQIIFALEEMVPDVRQLLAVTLPQPLSDLQAQAEELQQLRDLHQLHTLTIGRCCQHKTGHPLWRYEPEQQSG